jgi:4-hydroxybenzoate polyprenyltransferase
LYRTITTAALIAATSGRHFSIGPWIIVPILILAAIIGTIIYVVKDRQNRRARQPMPRKGSS